MTRTSVNAFSVCILLLLSGCEEQAQQLTDIDAVATDNGRWYSAEQLVLGAEVFSANCASCHGDRAQGLADDWRQRGADGAFPPPPLNGTAHAWHHPKSVLLQQINQGGIPLGGKMPAFDALLTDAEKDAAIAWFQQFWSDEIYQSWLQMGGVN